jgi:hypothetical protein
MSPRNLHQTSCSSPQQNFSAVAADTVSSPPGSPDEVPSEVRFPAEWVAPAVAGRVPTSQRRRARIRDLMDGEDTLEAFLQALAEEQAENRAKRVVAMGYAIVSGLGKQFGLLSVCRRAISYYGGEKDVVAYVGIHEVSDQMYNIKIRRGMRDRIEVKRVRWFAFVYDTCFFSPLLLSLLLCRNWRSFGMSLL